ncbi:MAG: universal stress protein [Pseudomonadota bacterium]|nr:universal stress protein [Pseudomonadota bacterium]
MINRILVPVDGSDVANRAIIFASEMAAALPCDLNLMTVQKAVPARQQLQAYLTHLQSRPADQRDTAEIASVLDVLSESAEAQSRTILTEAEALARLHGALEIACTLRDGDPATEILAMAENEPIDLIILGRRGAGNIRELLLGSVALRVTQAANCPVTLIR